jgi:hypothetical protein
VGLLCAVEAAGMCEPPPGDNTTADQGKGKGKGKEENWLVQRLLQRCESRDAIMAGGTLSVLEIFRTVRPVPLSLRRVRCWVVVTRFGGQQPPSCAHASSRHAETGWARWLSSARAVP